MNGNMIYFSDFFDVATEILDDYGAFNISMLNDLPLFIDPFLIFCNDKPEYQAMHERIIRYLRFLRDESTRQHDISAGALRSLYCFPEVKQTYLGFCQNGNSGSGLGMDFARALHSSLKDIFTDFGEETITKSPHLEKLCLIKRNVGRDNISDFVTNLIKPFLLEYTQAFARAYLPAEKCRVFSVSGVVFDESKKVWLPANFYLPYYDNDYVLLTPTDLLVRDDTWINRPELIKNFERFAPSIPDDALRYQVNQYFAELLSEKPTKEERERAAEMTVSRYPALIDYYIRRKEDNEDGAYERSAAEVGNVQQIFITQLQELVEQLKNDSAFYSLPSNTFDEALQRVNYLKHVIENCDGYRWFYDGDKPIRRESDLHLMYKLVCYNTVSSTDAEVNNGMGPVDFKHSYGSRDSTLVEFKLVRTLKKNLEKQVEVYLDANVTDKAIKVILYFTDEEEIKVNKILNDLGLTGKLGIVLIDARKDNKVSASKSR